MDFDLIGLQRWALLNGTRLGLMNPQQAFIPRRDRGAQPRVVVLGLGFLSPLTCLLPKYGSKQLTALATNFS